MSKLMNYGYVPDNDESLQSKDRGSFGGNFGCVYITQFEYKENVAKEGEPEREAIEVVINIKQGESKTWFSPINKVFGDKNEELQADHKDYANNYNAAVLQQNAVVIHYLKALGVSEEAIKNALSQGFTSFKAYSDAIIALIPAGFEKRPLDLFQEYQWNIGKKASGELNEKTYPQIPRNMKGGYFLVTAQPGSWKEVVGDDGSLSYVNANGVEHPFKRSSRFMESNKGTQQFLNSPSSEVGVAQNPMAQQGAPQQTDWGQ